MKNNAFHLLKLTGFLTLFSLPIAIFANIIIDADVPATMNTSGNQYIVGSDGPFERDLGSTTVTVGNTNPDVSLVIQNGGVLSNGIGRIGNGSGSNGNSVTVTGSGSTWNNSGDFYVGVSGSNNSLTISDGGAVINNTGNIGNNSDSTGNVVTVTDPNSMWSGIHIVRLGSEGNISVLNGGKILLSGSASLSGNDNIMTIDGTGSSIELGSLSFGTSGAIAGGGTHNSLTVSNGGKISANSTRISSYYDLGTSHSNTVTVTGNGSTWNSNFQTSIHGSNNGFIVSDEGSASIGNAILSGAQNAVTIHGNGSSIIAASFSFGGSFGFESFGSTNNSLIIEAGGFMQTNIIKLEKSSNKITVTGLTSSLTVYETFSFASDGGSNNSLTIENGGLVAIDGDITFHDLGDNLGNFLRFDGGYLAWQGNQVEGITNFLDLEFIQVWNGEEWVTATSETLIYSFFADDASALAFSGYDDLGGYTIVTTVAVPEPSLFAILLGSISGGFICLRRMRRISQAPTLYFSGRHGGADL